MRETRITLGILEQDKIWITRDGRVLKLEDMELSHRRNVLRILERRAISFHWRAFMHYFVFPLGGRPNGELSNSVFDRAEDEFLEKKPIVWLREQPLVRRLRTLVDEDDARERRIALTLTRNHVVAHPPPVKRLGGLRRE